MAMLVGRSIVSIMRQEADMRLKTQDGLSMSDD